jgi:hypothetical protein
MSEVPVAATEISPSKKKSTNTDTAKTLTSEDVVV